MTESDDQKIIQPPLTIGHIMAWTMGTALLLVFFKINRSMYGELDSHIRATISGQYIAHCLIQGPAVAFLGVFLVRKIRGGAPLPVEPGHWMLLVGGVSAVFGLLVNLIRYQIQGFAFDSWLYFTFVYVPSFILLILAIRAKRSKRLWRVFFAVSIVQSIFQILIPLTIRVLPIQAYSVMSFVFFFLPMFILISAIIDDRINKRRRDWIHWVGVMVQAASVVLSGFLTVLFSIFF